MKIPFYALPAILLATTTADVVQGIVYLDVDEAAIARLDQFEDDFYRR